MGGAALFGRVAPVGQIITTIQTILMSATFSYPNVSAERFQRLLAVFKEHGGTVSSNTPTDNTYEGYELSGFGVFADIRFSPAQSQVLVFVKSSVFGDALVNSQIQQAL